MGEYRALNAAPRFVHADLAFDLRAGLASLPPAVGDMRVSASAVLATAVGLHHPALGSVTLNAFALRVAEKVDKEFCADPLHEQAQRLRYHNVSLAAAAAFEALEDGAPSPPHVGALMRELLHDETVLAAIVGLRPDLTSVKAMMKDAAWLAPGGWREKAIVELDLVLNQRRPWFLAHTRSTSATCSSTATVCSACTS